MKSKQERIGIFTVAGDDQHAQIKRGRKVVEEIDESSAFQKAINIAGRMNDHYQAVKHGPSSEGVRKLFDLIQQYGRTCFDHKAEVRRGQCIGIAYARISSPEECGDAAMTMLEDWNSHLATAAVAAIERGEGVVKRKGRRLTIMLPEWWEKA